MKHRISATLFRFWRVSLALVGGLISSLAFPRENLAPLIFISVALLVISVRNLKFIPATAVGLVGGLAFYLSQIEWLSLYLGPVPWLALSILEAAIFALGIGVLAMVWNWLDSKLAKENSWRTLLIALALAIIFTAREWVSINLPYGGFPWSRLVQTQSETFLSRWVYYGGLGWLTLLIALLSIIGALWFITFLETKSKPNWREIIAAGFVLLVPALTVLPAGPETGSMVVGAVQGNANAGLFANPNRGSILQNHLDATELLNESDLADEIDLVVWPENASDLSPFISVAASQAITELVDQELKVPLIFGAITARGENIYNSSILWQPQLGATDWYDKKRPVPFAEYVPDRDFWYQLAPDLIGLISRGYSFGERDGIFEVNNAKLGALICFEIAIDDIGRDLVSQGAQIILSQTNNADFGRSDETYQQAAFARLRAIETGRTVVNISTVGVSAIYAADGSVLQQLPTFEPGVLVQKVALRNSITPAMLIGSTVDLLVNLFALVLLALAIAFRIQSSKGEKP